MTLTATVSGGLSPTGAVTFQDGSTVLGKVALSGSTARLTVSSLAAGVHSIVAAYGGDANNPAATSGVATISVNARPNPAANSDVIGLVAAQVSTATRFGQTQIDNTARRFEQWHDEDDEDFTPNVQPQGQGRAFGPSAFGGGGSGGLSALAGGGSASAANPAGGGATLAAASGFPAAQGFSPPPPGQFLAYSADDPRANGLAKTNDSERAIQALAGGLPMAVASLDKANVLPFHVWMAGSIDFGRLKADGSADNHFATSGMTLGFDGRVADKLKAGVALGFGADHSAIGTDGTKVDASTFNAMVYADYRIMPHSFIDLTAGYGGLRYNLARWSTDGDVMLNGVRDGANAFGSIAFTQEIKWEGLKFSPYGRVDIIRTMLDGYTETGSSIWALNYNTLDETTVSGVLGARVAYKIPTAWGLLTPMARLEYRHAFEGGYAQGLNYADLAGSPGYVLPGSAIARDALTGGVTLRAQTNDLLTLELEYLLTGGIDNQLLAQRIRASANYAF